MLPFCSPLNKFVTYFGSYDGVVSGIHNAPHVVSAMVQSLVYRIFCLKTVYVGVKN